MLARLAFGITEGSAPQEIVARDAALRRLLTLADALAALVALYVAVPVLGADRLTLASLLVVPVVLMGARAMRLHDRDHAVIAKSTLNEAPTLFNVAMLCALAMYVGQDWFVEGRLGPGQGLLLFTTFLVTSLAARATVRRLSLRQAPAERCLVIGDAAHTELVRSKLSQSPVGCSKVTVSIDPAQLPKGVEGQSFLAELVEETRVHRVIVAAPHLETEELLETIRHMKALGVKVSIRPRVFDVIGSAVEFDDVHGSVFLGVRRFGLSTGQRRTKRALDLVGAVLLLIAIAPLLAVFAIAIRLDSRGPVLFRQQRIGREGRPFSMYKFRSMVVDADAQKAALRERNEADGLFKIVDDPRITRVGGWLRRLSLDELPQLINVLRGEMSLVGPRPLVADEDRRIEGWHRRRLHLTPGMTGVWQVMGSARIPMHEMVALDYLYIVNWSMWRDIEILLRTAGFVAGRRGL